MRPYGINRYYVLTTTSQSIGSCSRDSNMSSFGDKEIWISTGIQGDTNLVKVNHNSNEIASKIEKADKAIKEKCMKQ